MKEIPIENYIQAFNCILQIWLSIIVVGFIVYINYKVTKDIENGNRD